MTSVARMKISASCRASWLSRDVNLDSGFLVTRPFSA
jgi:hypothetical protein